MSEHSARQLTDEIRADLFGIVEQRDRVVKLIMRARDEGAHADLGYSTWTTYVSTEFGSLLARLDAAERRPLVRALREIGMSTRAIAPIVGMSQSQVSRDDSPDEDDEPLPPVTGLDGKHYPTTRLRTDASLLSELDRKRDQQKREQAERRQADVERFDQTARAVHALANISGPWMSDYDDDLVDHYTREAFDSRRLLAARAHLEELITWSNSRTTGRNSSTK